jgi:ribosome biogenesis GTPase
MNINKLGWNDHFQQYFSEQTVPGAVSARISAEYRGQYLAQTDTAELQAEVSGALRYKCDAESDFPKVGDWVVITIYDENKALIHRILPRLNSLARKKAGTGFDEQVLATNISVIGVVMGLDHDYNLRRLERYIALSKTMNCRLLIILNKADLFPTENVSLQEIKKISAAPVLTISAFHQSDIAELRKNFLCGDTVVFLGSSGVGKSTIVNARCGENIQKTVAVREDDSRGRHTTTSRELFVIEPGLCIIDTPGIRELQLWTNDGSTLDNAFADIAELAKHCRFSDCGHASEPGCAVQAAIQKGALPAARWENYLKLRREQAFLESKVNDQAFLERKSKERKLHKLIRKVLDNKYGEH